MRHTPRSISSYTVPYTSKSVGTFEAQSHIQYDAEVITDLPNFALTSIEPKQSNRLSSKLLITGVDLHNPKGRHRNWNDSTFAFRGKDGELFCFWYHEEGIF